MRHNYQPLKRKFGAFVIAVSLFELVGCAGPAYRQQIDPYAVRTSCETREKDIEFLRALRQTALSEQDKAWFEVKFNPFTEDGLYKQKLANGYIVHQIDSVIFDLRQCPDRPLPKRFKRDQE